MATINHNNFDEAWKIGSGGTNGTVLVQRQLLQEVITDGCCPLHLRLQLNQAMLNGSCEDTVDARCFGQGVSLPSTVEESSGLFTMLDPRCLAAVAGYLPIAEVLTSRACSREASQWAMQRATEKNGVFQQIHDRIRVRLWMQRIEEVTAGSSDESIFETRMRACADQALRARMENEMQEALAHMENQIHSFQAEVDRRLEEQEQHVRSLVEERVQKELDAILATEVGKVQAMVEERIRERVSSMFQGEMREVVRELQAKVNVLLNENELLQDAFAEANLRAKMLFWAIHPPVLHMCRAIGFGLGGQLLLSPKYRALLT